jgi:hypothetical protein
MCAWIGTAIPLPRLTGESRCRYVSGCRPAEGPFGAVGWCVVTLPACRSTQGEAGDVAGFSAVPLSRPLLLPWCRSLLVGCLSRAGLSVGQYVSRVPAGRAVLPFLLRASTPSAGSGLSSACSPFPLSCAPLLLHGASGSGPPSVRRVARHHRAPRLREIRQPLRRRPRAASSDPSGCAQTLRLGSRGILTLPSAIRLVGFGDSAGRGAPLMAARPPSVRGVASAAPDIRTTPKDNACPVPCQQV